MLKPQDIIGGNTVGIITKRYINQTGDFIFIMRGCRHDGEA
jgi:hypothetical protein